MLATVSLLLAVQLGDQDKLETLRRLDQFRHWRSLDDKRCCLVCGKLINGWQIRVMGGTRGNGSLRIICPTERCRAIPMDWVLPSAEVLAKTATTSVESRHVRASKFRRDIGKNSIASRLREFAARWNRSA
jgi:hypothetical protein